MTERVGIKIGEGMRGLAAPALVLAALLLALSALMAALAPRAEAQAAADLRATGPGGVAGSPFPTYYQDARGLKVAACLEKSPQCELLQEIGGPPVLPDQNAPVSYPNNFPDNFPYWGGEASVVFGAGTVDLIMGVDGTFVDPNTGLHGTAAGGGIPAVEGGILVKGVDLKPNTSYQIAYPYGNMRVKTDNVGRFKRIIESGCAIEFVGQTCDFDAVLQSPIFGGFLKWNPNVAPAAPAGYLGDGHVGHTVVGSPVKDASGKPQNYLKVQQLRPGKAPIVKQTSEFFITGMRFAG